MTISQLSQHNITPSTSTQSSLVVGITGPRGSGKTLLLAYLGVMDMKHGRRVVSNIDIHGPVKRRGKLVEVKSELLSFDALLSLSETLEECVVCIDEINLWFSSMRAMGNANRIAGIFTQLIRKRNISLNYTTQNFRWVDGMIRWQTDLLVACQDIFHTPAGKEEGIGRGEYTRYVAVDRSGYLTGVPYEVSGKYFTGILEARPIWRYYNTNHVVDPWEAMSKVELKRPTKVVDLTGSGEGEAEEAVPPLPENAPPENDELRRFFE